MFNQWTKKSGKALMLILAIGLMTAGVAYAQSMPAPQDITGIVTHGNGELQSVWKILIVIAQLGGLLVVIGSITTFIKARNEHSQKTYGHALVMAVGGVLLYVAPVILGVGSMTIFG